MISNNDIFYFFIGNNEYVFNFKYGQKKKPPGFNFLYTTLVVYSKLHVYRYSNICVIYLQCTLYMMCIIIL